jgi:hypothetical protein
MRWYYHDGQKPIGPLDEADIIQLASTGEILHTSQVWKEGTPAWVAAGSSELNKHLLPDPPPIPQIGPPPFPTSAQTRPAGLVQPRVPARHVGWMTFWGFIWAGLGQLILGQSAKGIVLMVADALCMLVPGGILIALVLSIVSAIDANKVAKRLKAGNPVDPWSFFPDSAL